MNADRRKRLKSVVEKLTAAKQELDDIAAEEQDAFDNLPEGIQESDRGDAMQQNADDIYDHVQALDEVVDAIEDTIAA